MLKIKVFFAPSDEMLEMMVNDWLGSMDGKISLHSQQLAVTRDYTWADTDRRIAYVLTLLYELIS